MAKFLQLALWNANGLSQQTKGLQTFISIHNIDVMLISETYFIERSYLKIPNYTAFHMNHIDGTARGSTAIIQFNSILYYLCAESTATRPITDTAQYRYT
jgi:hypothetical protein